MIDKSKRSCIENCGNYISCIKSGGQPAWDCERYIEKLPDESKKDSNPKYSAGVKKAPLHCLPCGPLFELGLAMFEGSRKYGRHNYRAIGVRASVYYDAIERHIKLWWEGNDIDPDSGIHHLIKAMACCLVVRDSMLMGNFNDDRPLRYPNGLDMDKFNRQTEALLEKYPDCEKPFLEKDKQAKKPNKATLAAIEELEATIEHVPSCGWQIRLANGMFLNALENTRMNNYMYAKEVMPFYYGTRQQACYHLNAYLETFS